MHRENVYDARPFHLQVTTSGQSKCEGVPSAPAGAARAFAPKPVLETVLRKTHLICVSSGQADGDAKSPTLCVAVENTETGDKFSKVPPRCCEWPLLSSESQSCFLTA